MTARPVAEHAVEVEQPRIVYSGDPDCPFEDYEPIIGLTLEPDHDLCQAATCAFEERASIGWVIESSEDTYGRETEGARWRTPFRLPDGRLVCEDDSQAWNEGEDL